MGERESGGMGVSGRIQSFQQGKLIAQEAGTLIDGFTKSGFCLVQVEGHVEVLGALAREHKYDGWGRLLHLAGEL